MGKTHFVSDDLNIQFGDEEQWTLSLQPMRPIPSPHTGSHSCLGLFDLGAQYRPGGGAKRRVFGS